MINRYRLRLFFIFFKNVKPKVKVIKKGVSENHAHILLAAFTSFTRKKKRSKPLLGIYWIPSNCSYKLF